jgi:hypothetical protein
MAGWYSVRDGYLSPHEAVHRRDPYRAYPLSSFQIIAPKS